MVPSKDVDRRSNVLLSTAWPSITYVNIYVGGIGPNLLEGEDGMKKLRLFTSRRAVLLAAVFLTIPVGCSRSGGSRFNGGSNDTVNVPVPPSQAPSVTALNVLGEINPVTGAVVNATQPFAAPVQFSYVLDDAEDEPLSLLVEFARAATPTQFQTATLIGASNPITGLQAINYENPNSPLNVFTWDATTDLGAAGMALNETVQFRITPSDAANTGASAAVQNGITFAFPAPPNNPPSIVTFAPANAGQQTGRVTFNYEVTDPDGGNVSLSVFFIGPPATPGGPPPAPQPMTLIQVNGAPATPVDGVPVDPNNPNVITVGPANFTGTFVWDSLTDIGISAFADFTFQAQITDGIDAGPNVTTPAVSIGNPTAAFVQNLNVVGRSGNITLGVEVFDSDSDTCDVSFEVTFNGTDFVPMTLANPTVGTVNGNTINGVPSSPTGAGLSLTWTSTTDIPAGVTSGMIRVTVVDDDRAVTVPTGLPSQPVNPTAPPLPNLFIHGGSAGFPQGTLFLLSSTISLAGPPVVVSVRADGSVSNPFYAPTIAQNGRFTVEGTNFGTDETVVTVLVNNISQGVIEADSNVVVAVLTERTRTGLLQVIVNGVPSNSVPVLVRGDDYWEDSTVSDAFDQAALPTTVDPSVHGQFSDLDGDGDLDVVVAQDGANTILINQNSNESISTLNPGPFNITPTNNRLDVYIVKSAISRNRGPFNVNQLDNLTVTTINQSNGATPVITAPFTSTSPATMASIIPSGQSFVATSTAYVAGLANQTATANSVGRNRHFSASVLNRRHLEIFPTLPFEKLTVFETSTSTFPNRRPLGFNHRYSQGFGSTGTDLLVVTGTGPYNVGDVLNNGNVSTTIARVVDNGNGSFNLDVLPQPSFLVNQTLVNQAGTPATITSIERNPGIALGGETLTLTLPTGSVTALSIANMLNDAAITAGLDVPGQTVNLQVASNAGFSVGTAVTNQLGSMGTVITVIDNNRLRIRSTNAFNTGDDLIVGGNVLTSVTNLLETRVDFVARTSNNGLTLDLFSNDVLVVGNGSANQPLGFRSQRLQSLQAPDQTGNYSFPTGFTDLQISVGDGTSSGNTLVTVPLSGTLSITDVVTAINNAGLQARLNGNNAAGVFSATAEQDGPNGKRFIEMTVPDPNDSIHVVDAGAQRVLGFTGRFVKPHARGLGNFTDETGARLPGQVAEFSTKIEVFDADEDGDPDLLVSNAVGLNRLLISTNRGVFNDMSATLIPNLIDETFAVATGDLDNDGDFDIAVANRGRDRVLENRTGELDPNNNNAPFAAGTMTDRSFTAFQGGPRSSFDKFSSDVQIGDLDGDGLLDLVYGHLQRADGSNGPRIFFNRNITFAASTSQVGKFNQESLNYADDGQPNVDLTRESFLQETLSISNAGGNFSSNFSLALGDVNADGRIDIVAGNVTSTAFNFQNKAFVQSPFTVTFTPARADTRMRKGQSVFLTTDINQNQGLAIREVLQNFPALGQDTLVLDNSPNLAVFTVGQNITTDPTPFSRTVTLLVGPVQNLNNKVFIRVDDTAGNVNLFQPGDRIIGGTSGAEAIIRDVIDDPDNPNTFDFLEVDDINIFVVNELITAVPAGGMIDRIGLTVFASRNQIPPFQHNIVQGVSDSFQSLFDYPENFDQANNTIDYRGSDSSKDVALGDLNSVQLVPTRTPQNVTGLVEATTSPLGGGGTTFARFVVFANNEDRKNSPFDFSNILFVINKANGTKNSFSDIGTPFVSTPFVNNDMANERAHMPADTVGSFGVDMGDIDNDGDLDILFLNGGAQGAGSQNLLYTANKQPNNLDNFNTAIP